MCDVCSPQPFWNTDDTNDGGLLTHPSKIKDITWFSHNCKYSYPIQGIHDIQFKPSCVDRSGDQKHIAVGTHTGQINLYNYPVVVPKVALLHCTMLLNLL